MIQMRLVSSDELGCSRGYKYTNNLFTDFDIHLYSENRIYRPSVVLLERG
jgi:hypothetical protein